MSTTCIQSCLLCVYNMSSRSFQEHIYFVFLRRVYSTSTDVSTVWTPTCLVSTGVACMTAMSSCVYKACLLVSTDVFFHGISNEAVKSTAACTTLPAKRCRSTACEASAPLKHMFLREERLEGCSMSPLQVSTRREAGVKV